MTQTIYRFDSKNVSDNRGDRGDRPIYRLHDCPSFLSKSVFRTFVECVGHTMPLRTAALHDQPRHRRERLT